MKKVTIFLGAAFLLMTVETGTGKSMVLGTTETFNGPGDEEAIRNFARQEIAFVNAGDFSGLKKIISEDVEYFIPAGITVKGREAMSFMQDFFSNHTFRARPYRDEEIVVSGDLAYHRYTMEWEITPKAGGDAWNEKGAGIHILKRRTDGSWVLVKDIWIRYPEGK